ncbi:MAG TPA: lytic transglycosylase domain-containing protein [Candidatus Binataceae bacterium]|nr:lytic transglycosylase domain-containing protein [Candidatus Binataceae bacterium]
MNLAARSLRRARPFRASGRPRGYLIAWRGLRAISGLLILVLLWVGGASAQSGSWSPQEMARLYQVVGRMYGVDPGLLAAIAQVESANDPSAVSPKGAQGLMQLMPQTAQRYAVRDPFDPVQSVLGAARFLVELRSWAQLTFPTSSYLPEILAAYNAGPAAVQKYGGIPPYQETHAYVRRVLWAYLLGVMPPPPSRAGRSSASPLPHPVRRRAAIRPPAPSALEQLAAIQRARAQALKQQPGLDRIDLHQP